MVLYPDEDSFPSGYREADLESVQREQKETGLGGWGRSWARGQARGGASSPIRETRGVVKDMWSVPPLRPVYCAQKPDWADTESEGRNRKRCRLGRMESVSFTVRIEGFSRCGLRDIHGGLTRDAPVINLPDRFRTLRNRCVRIAIHGTNPRRDRGIAPLVDFWIVSADGGSLWRDRGYLVRVGG